MNSGNYNILGLKLTVSDINFILRMMKTYLKRNRNFLVESLPINQIVLANLNKDLYIVLNKFDCLLPESIWVMNSINFLYGTNFKNRIRGTELMLKICRMAEKEGFKIFLCGSTQSTLQALSNKLLSDFPKLKIVGFLSPPFRNLAKEEKENIIEVIDKSMVDILFIALGTPRQEIFAHDLLYKKPTLSKPIVIVPVGAVFDFISGTKPQAPKLIQETGLEWLFRFICEPGRLWKRYLIYGPLFLMLVISQKITMSLKKSI